MTDMEQRTYRLGDDGQTVYLGNALVAFGASPQAASALVQRLNSQPVRQEDVDLLLWLLAEARDHNAWWQQMGEVQLRNMDRLEEERDTARVDAAFWSTLNGGGR